MHSEMREIGSDQSCQACLWERGSTRPLTKEFRLTLVLTSLITIMEAYPHLGILLLLAPPSSFFFFSRSEWHSRSAKLRSDQKRDHDEVDGSEIKCRFSVLCLSFVVVNLLESDNLLNQLE